MAYVDAIHLKDAIHVVERVNGKRIYKDFPAEHTFYYDDHKGKFQTTYRTPVSKYTTRHKKTFQSEVRRHHGKRLWESDIRPLNRHLEQNYLGANTPKLQTCFLDIETDFDPDYGFAPTDDPFNKITAISLYLQWTKQLITLAIPPR